MIHNKYLTLSFFEDNDCILAKSVAQMLFSNLEQTFLFFEFFNYCYVIVQIVVHLHLLLILSLYQKNL